MTYKDNMGKEIKNIFEEETKDIKLSQASIERIMGSRKSTLRQRISNFLNREIEIPLTPAIIGFVVIIGISTFPKGFVSREKVEIINFNGSQIIMKSSKEVSMK